jgi:ABC-2 type transport system ATP-binding protein
MSIIEVDNLSKNYGKIIALDGLNLNIEKGECIAMLGPNGAGKSTFLKIATNVVHPTSGTVKIGGVIVEHDPMSALEKVGPLVELPEFYPYLNGKEVMDYVCRVKGASREEIKSETERLSGMLSMDDYIGRKCGQYSRGMKQRLALACAMVMEPDVLILDEPTFGLDPRGMREFIDIIVDINKKKNKTIIMSTHLISEAREIASRVIIMNHGKKMVDMKNERDISLMKVTFSGSLDSNALSYAGIEVVENGTDWATITAKNDESNKDIILKLVNLGMEVKWVEPVNSIEKTYLDIVE